MVTVIILYGATKTMKLLAVKLYKLYKHILCIIAK